jgi:hypothetical protein
MLLSFFLSWRNEAAGGLNEYDFTFVRLIACRNHDDTGLAT